jgi:acetyl-CoA acetyltransferase
VVAGAVLKHSRDFNMTRECVLNTQLAPETPAYDIQQACGTGLQAAFLLQTKLLWAKSKWVLLVVLIRHLMHRLLW